MARLITELRKHIRHHELVVIAFFVGIVVFFIPLQHYVSLSRFQHYGICLGVWAGGFFLQLLVSWRRMGFWGRAYLGVASIYLAMFAHVIYTNPWLDPRMALETSVQGSSRQELAQLFLGLGIVLSCTWFGWSWEEKKRGRGK